MTTHKGDPLHLRRIITTGTWIPQIDGLRFIAISSVVLFHIMRQLELRTGHPIAFQPRYAILATLGGNRNRGVLLFFVISGYIIARPFLRQHRLHGKPVDLGAYYLRRVTRLEPPYILVLLLISAVAILAYGVSPRSLLPHLAASMFYLHGLVYQAKSTIAFVAWSLEIEVQFYLIAPLLGAVYRLRNTIVRRSAVITLLIAGSAFSVVSASRDNVFFDWTLIGFLQYFMTGFLLADVVEGHQQQPHRSFAWDGVSLIGWPLVFLWPNEWLPDAVLPLLFLILCMAAFYGPLSSRFFRVPFVALAGGMCYSFYLTHMLAISLAFKATRHLAVFDDFLANYAIQIATMAIPIALLGTLYYVVIERPCMDPHWPRKAFHILRHSTGSTIAVEPPNPAP